MVWVFCSSLERIAFTLGFPEKAHPTGIRGNPRPVLISQSANSNFRKPSGE